MHKFRPNLPMLAVDHLKSFSYSNDAVNFPLYKYVPRF